MKILAILLCLISTQAFAINIDMCLDERQAASVAIEKFHAGKELSTELSNISDQAMQRIYVRAWRWVGTYVDFPYYIENLCYRRQLNID